MPRVETDLEMGQWEPFRVLELFCLDCGGGYIIYTFVKVHTPELFKWVNFVVYKLYLCNVDLKKIQGEKKGISPEIILLMLYKDLQIK